MSISARLYFVLGAFVFTSLLLIANQVFSQKQFSEIDEYLLSNQQIVIEQSASVIELNSYVEKLKKPFIDNEAFNNRLDIQPTNFQSSLEVFLQSKNFDALPKTLQHNFTKSDTALKELIKTGDILEKEYKLIDTQLVEKLLSFKTEFLIWKNKIALSLLNKQIAEVQINYQQAPIVNWYKNYLDSNEYNSLPEELQLLILQLYKPLKKVYNSAANIVLMQRDGKLEKANKYYNKKSIKYLKKMDKVLNAIAIQITSYRDANNVLKSKILSQALKDIDYY
jgi:hypothetical protein